jgi:hypothetical protein
MPRSPRAAGARPGRPPRCPRTTSGEPSRAPAGGVSARPADEPADAPQGRRQVVHRSTSTITPRISTSRVTKSRRGSAPHRAELCPGWEGTNAWPGSAVRWAPQTRTRAAPPAVGQHHSPVRGLRTGRRLRQDGQAAARLISITRALGPSTSELASPGAFRRSPRPPVALPPIAHGVPCRPAAGPSTTSTGSARRHPRAIAAAASAAVSVPLNLSGATRMRTGPRVQCAPYGAGT